MLAPRHPKAAQRAVEQALNGDIDKIDPPVRRGLIALATEHDDGAHEIRAAVEELTDMIETRAKAAEDNLAAAVERIERRITVATRLLITTAVTFITTTAGLLVAIATAG